MFCCGKRQNNKGYLTNRIFIWHNTCAPKDKILTIFIVVQNMQGGQKRIILPLIH